MPVVTPGWWLLGARASPLPTRVLATWVLPLGDNPASYDTVLIWGLFCLLFFNEKVYTAIQGNPKEGQAASVNGSTRSGLVPGAIAGEASASSRLDPATSFSLCVFGTAPPQRARLLRGTWGVSIPPLTLPSEPSFQSCPLPCLPTVSQKPESTPQSQECSSTSPGRASTALPCS